VKEDFFALAEITGPCQEPGIFQATAKKITPESAIIGGFCLCRVSYALVQPSGLDKTGEGRISFNQRQEPRRAEVTG
jgi:hypothetical protein